MAQKMDFDALVIGAGHNGLAAAATLASKGKKVCVLERSPEIGGMSRNVTLAGGVTAPEIAHLLYNLNPVVMKELGIGLGLARLEKIPLSTVALAMDGNHVLIKGNKVTFADGSPHPEATVFADMRQRLVRFAALLGQLATSAPPSLSGGLMNIDTLKQLTGLAKLGFNLKRMGKKEMREFLRILLSNAYDLILDDLADGPLAGALAADSVRGSWCGPRSPGTVFSLMYRFGQGGDIALPKGGMGAVAGAFAAAARNNGCEIRTGVSVRRVLIENDAVKGVELADGAIVSAPVVLSSVGAQQSMMLAGVEHFDVEVARRLRNMRCKGTVAKINLVLSAVPQFTGLTQAQAASRLLISPSATYVERAFNPAKYGEMSEAPVIELVIPTLSDTTLAPEGQHILSAIVQFIPYDLKGGWSKKRSKELQKLVVDTLEIYAPGIGNLITHAEVLSPADIEQRTGAPGGHWHHGEMSFDQMLNLRPVNGLAQYQLEVSGYYLCGASAHPGGDVTGAPGRNSALQALKDEGLS